MNLKSKLTTLTAPLVVLLSPLTAHAETGVLHDLGSLLFGDGGGSGAASVPELGGDGLPVIFMVLVLGVVLAVDRRRHAGRA